MGYRRLNESGITGADLKLRCGEGGKENDRRNGDGGEFRKLGSAHWGPPGMTQER
jgi:hypothetical protein